MIYMYMMHMVKRVILSLTSDSIIILCGEFVWALEFISARDSKYS